VAATTSTIFQRKSKFIGVQLPLKAASAGFFVSRGKGIHPTRVMDSWELIFVKSGTLGMFEEERTFNLSAGQALILWPGKRHGGTVNYPKDLSFYWIHFYIEGGRPSAGGEVLELPQVTTLHDEDRLVGLLRRFLDDQENGRLKHPASALLILQMLCEVSAAGVASERASAPVSALAAKVETYIRTNFHLAISTIDIADHFECNPDYLGRVFRRVTGKTIIDFIHHTRMWQARKLLIDSALNIDQIARECGFDDAGYFRRLFVRHAGMPPKKFRRLHARMFVNTE
jgi:AraC-like DNA-binding protein